MKGTNTNQPPEWRTVEHHATRSAAALYGNVREWCMEWHVQTHTAAAHDAATDELFNPERCE